MRAIVRAEDVWVSPVQPSMWLSIFMFLLYAAPVNQNNKISELSIITSYLNAAITSLTDYQNLTVLCLQSIIHINIP